jgi:hypothetical protein
LSSYGIYLWHAAPAWQRESIASVRGHRFQKLIAETRAAIEEGDIERAKELLRRCPAGHERVAAGLLFDYASPLGRKEPSDLLLQLYERARTAKLSLIDEYAQAPEAIEGFGRRF